MLNLFRMEVYKIFREKSIYITAAAILGVIFIALATMKVITSPDLLHSAMESGMDITAEDLQDAQAFQNSTQVDFLGSLLFSGGLMVCLMAIVSAIFVCDDFTTGFGKNIFSYYPKRSWYIISKLMTLAIVSGFFLIVFTLLTFLSFRLMGFENAMGNLNSMMLMLVIGWLSLMSLCAQNLLFCMLTRKVVLSSILSILCGLGVVSGVLEFFSGFFGIHVGSFFPSYNLMILPVLSGTLTNDINSGIALFLKEQNLFLETHMLILICFFGILLLFAGFRLYLYGKQMREWTRQLQELSPQSNQRLTCFVRDKATKALCLEMNNYIDAQQKAVLKSQEAERELKYTIACVSHDIRTPLTGAFGYIQLFEKTSDEKKQKKYGTIVRQKLMDLEQLLDELFLYTRLTGDAFPMEISKVRLLPLLCEVLNEFSLSFQEQEREPLLSFEDETIEVLGDKQQLRRVFQNLISNALAHGTGILYIEQKGASLVFQNQVPEPEKLHPEWLFQRFYRTDMSRQGTHAGLGLSIARELVERMGGQIWGERKDTMLCIKIAFAVRMKQEKENLK